MLLSPSSTDPIDIYTDGAIHLINERGLGGLTVRAMAEWMKVSPPAVSQRTSRDRLVADVVDRFGRRWLRWITNREYEHGVLALLPSDEDDVAAVRVWLAIVELGRDDGRTAQRVAQVRASERTILCRQVGRQMGRQVGPFSGHDPVRELGTDAIDRLIALIDGLRMALCAPVDPMSVPRAVALLSDHPSIR